MATEMKSKSPTPLIRAGQMMRCSTVPRQGRYTALIKEPDYECITQQYCISHLHRQEKPLAAQTCGVWVLPPKVKTTRGIVPPRAKPQRQASLSQQCSSSLKAVTNPVHLIHVQQLKQTSKSLLDPLTAFFLPRTPLPPKPRTAPLSSPQQPAPLISLFSSCTEEKLLVCLILHPCPFFQCILESTAVRTGATRHLHLAQLKLWANLCQLH